MVGYSPEDGSGVLVAVLLTRKAGENQIELANLQLEKEMWSDESGETKKSSISLSINDKNYGKIGVNPQTGALELSRAQTDALVNSLLKTSKIIFNDEANGLVGRLSDRGATATFLKMDDWQGRLYTDTALVKKGERSHQQLKKMKIVPVIKRMKTRSLSLDDKHLFLKNADFLLEMIKETGKQNTDDDYCDHIFDGEKLEIVDRLSKDKLLVSGQCWMAAYNRGIGYWVINDQEPFLPKLVTTSASSYMQGKIEAVHKGRGIGDCWSYQSHIWNGTSFVLSHRSNTGLCRGFVGGVWDLPSYVSEVVAP